MTRPVSTDRPNLDTARANRGRLCSVELLPAAADAAVDAAADAVLARKRTQQDILLDLNEALVAIGATTIAPSSFNRWVTRIRRDGYVRRSGDVPRADDARRATTLGSSDSIAIEIGDGNVTFSVAFGPAASTLPTVVAEPVDNGVMLVVRGWAGERLARALRSPSKQRGAP